MNFSERLPISSPTFFHAGPGHPGSFPTDTTPVHGPSSSPPRQGHNVSPAAPHLFARHRERPSSSTACSSLPAPRGPHLRARRLDPRQGGTARRPASLLPSPGSLLLTRYLEELKNLRPQLYSASEYCKKSYLHAQQKQIRAVHSARCSGLPPSSASSAA